MKRVLNEDRPPKDLNIFDNARDRFLYKSTAGMLISYIGKWYDDKNAKTPLVWIMKTMRYDFFGPDHIITDYLIDKKGVDADQIYEIKWRRCPIQDIENKIKSSTEDAVFIVDISGVSKSDLEQVYEMLNGKQVIFIADMEYGDDIWSIDMFDMFDNVEYGGERKNSDSDNDEEDEDEKDDEFDDDFNESVDEAIENEVVLQDPDSILKCVVDFLESNVGQIEDDDYIYFDDKEIKIGKEEEFEADEFADAIPADDLFYEGVVLTDPIEDRIEDIFNA